MSLAAESDFLLNMAASSRLRDTAARERLSDAQQITQLTHIDSPVGLLLEQQGFDLIAEIKKRSPAEGELDAGLASPVSQAEAYMHGGAAVMSVLTEPNQFNGSLDDLHEIASQVAVPVMRKDFLVSRYQVREARLAGASGVLLIAAMLDGDQMKGMLDTAFELGMFVLMEVFEPAELELCVPILESYGAPLTNSRCNYLLGVNCRNLRSLRVGFDHFAAMAPELPDSMPWVAESGLTEPSHAQTVAELGYRMALVGSAFMRSANPSTAVKEFRAAGLAGASCS